MMQISNALRHQVWKLIQEYFPGSGNKTLRQEIFNAEFDNDRINNDCRILLDVVAFNSPELAQNKLTEIHNLALEAKGLAHA